MWQEGLPVSVPSTAELEQPVREGALLSDHCVMERVLIIVNDGKQRSPLHHGLKRLQPETEYRASLLDDFIKSVGVAGSDAAAPTHSSKENGASNNRLVEDLQHLAAHVERSQLPQEIESAHPLLVHSLGVGFPVQSVVDHHSQVFIVLHLLHHLPPDP